MLNLNRPLDTSVVFDVVYQTHIHYTAEFSVLVLCQGIYTVSLTTVLAEKAVAEFIPLLLPTSSHSLASSLHLTSPPSLTSSPSPHTQRLRGMERPGKSEGGKEKRGYPAREVRQRVRREGAPRRRLEQRTKKKHIPKQTIQGRP